jgi:hypothetical protein
MPREIRLLPLDRMSMDTETAVTGNSFASYHNYLETVVVPSGHFHPVKESGDMERKV